MHNEVPDLTASLLSEVCHDVKLKPHLQHLSGEIMQHRTAITDNEAMQSGHHDAGHVTSGAPGMRRCSWMSRSSILMLTPTGMYLSTPVSNSSNKPNVNTAPI